MSPLGHSAPDDERDLRGQEAQQQVGRGGEEGHEEGPRWERHQPEAVDDPRQATHARVMDQKCAIAS